MLQKTALVLLALVPLCRGADKYSKTNTQSWGFLPAGQVELRVCYGGVGLVPGGGSHTVLGYPLHSNHSDFERQAAPQSGATRRTAGLTRTAPCTGTREGH